MPKYSNHSQNAEIQSVQRTGAQYPRVSGICVRRWAFAFYIPHNVLERTLKCIKRNLGINAV